MVGSREKSITTADLKTEQTQPRSHWGGKNLESQDAFYRSTLSWINTLWNETFFPLRLLCVDVMFLPGIRSFSRLFFFFWSVREGPAFAKCPHPYLTRDISGVLMAWKPTKSKWLCIITRSQPITETNCQARSDWLSHNIIAFIFVMNIRDKRKSTTVTLFLLTEFWKMY